MNSKDRVGVLHAISNWMQLLGLIVLVAECTLLIALKLTPDGARYKDLYPLAIVLLLGVIVVGVFFDRFLQRPMDIVKRGTAKDVENIIPKIDTGGVPEIENALKSMTDGLKEALSVDNSVFQNAISRNINRFSYDVQNWKNGQLNVGPGDSKEYLLELYENARESVFSTSVKDFSSQWSENFGDRIIEANKRSSASITRVFVFDNREEMLREDFEQMKRQYDEGFNVRVYFDKEDPFFNFSPDLSRDFTIIDNGSVVGMTESFGRDNNSAKWYFNNAVIASRVRDIRDSLIRGSKPFDEVRSWWDGKHSH